MNPFVGLCKETDKKMRSIARWEEREKIREGLYRKEIGKYGLEFGWRVFVTRNKERNIFQISAFYRGEFAFHLIDVVPARKGFALRLSATGSRKHGEYNSRKDAVKCGKDWLIKNWSYTRGLRNEFLKDKS